ncbi:phosphatidylglycerophosphatase B [Pantoea sp. A4]|uniref:phosphatidylglycerophosphatase B n=1 Tax=Pantoea sp. A4 TaxID=1225184 RepID=UPI00035F47A2|nr:phosphatidylglycerophosphatase B [Pantoea sp. A4]
MLNILRRISLATALLLVMPITVWLTGWHWQPGASDLKLKLFFAVTETVTRPWGTLTSLLISAWVLWCLRFRLKPALVLLAIMNVTVIAGQYTGSLIKNQVQEARPYVVWLEQHHGIDERVFYQQTRTERSAMVNRLLVDEQTVPGWLKRHWAFETGFAFPSGHTLFAASWALLAVGLLWPRKRYLTLVIIFGWACAVMASRLLLGMHWPRDLVMATVVAGVWVSVATWLAQRFCGPLTLPPVEQKEVQERNNGL